MSSNHVRHDESELTKVTIRLDKSDWHDHGTETMWARPLGNNQFEIQNVPFYAYGLSYGDVVEVSDADGKNTVQSVVKRGGHSTYRIFVTNTESLERFQEFWQPLELAGCTVERATERLFAVDIPRQTDPHAAFVMLQAGEDASVWDFEEGHVGHPIAN